MLGLVKLTWPPVPTLLPTRSIRAEQESRVPASGTSVGEVSSQHREATCPPWPREHLARLGRGEVVAEPACPGYHRSPERGDVGRAEVRQDAGCGRR